MHANRAYPLILAACAAIASFALPARAGTIPQYINYQGKLGDSSGNPLSGTYSFRFKLYNAETGGTQLFTEDVTGVNAVSVVNGIYTVQIGSLTAGGISTAAFANAGVWLELDVNAGAALGGAETLTPRERFAATPFAFRAAAADFLGGGAVVSTFTSSGLMLFPYEVRAGSMSLTGGLTASSGTFTASGASQFSVRTTSGINVAAGGVVAPFFVGNGSGLTGITGTDATKVAKTGDTMTGQLVLNTASALTTTNQAAISIATHVAIPSSLLGVGGSTTTARLYSESQLDSIGPDTLVLYNNNQSGGSQLYNYLRATGNNASTRFLIDPFGSITSAGRVSVNGTYASMGNSDDSNYLARIKGTLHTGGYASYGLRVEPSGVNQIFDTQTAIYGYLSGATGSQDSYAIRALNTSSTTAINYALAASATGTGGTGHNIGGYFTASGASSNQALVADGVSVFGSGAARSTFTTTGALSLAANAALALSGATGNITSGSSITTTGGFFGNGSGLTNISVTDATKVAKAGDAMTGPLTMNNSSITVYGAGTEASPTRSGLFGASTANGDVILDLGQTIAGRDLRLHVAGADTRTDGLTANDQYITATQRLNIFSRGNANSNNVGISLGASGSSSYADMTFYTSTAGATGAEVARLTGSGKLGVGTGAAVEPSARLQVSSASALASDLIFHVSSGTAAGQSLLRVFGNGSTALTGGLTASSGTFTASGASQYSVRTTSGISVGAGGVVAPFFVGSGAALTGITAGALPANVAYTDAANAFSGLNTFSNTTRVNATLQVDGALVTSNQPGLLISTPAYMNSGVSIGGAGGGEYGSIAYGVTYGPATSAYYYRFSDTANHLQFTGGHYVFSNAPAGTVGNAITFTERMRLTAQGALGVGTNAPTNRLHVNGGLTASSGTFTLTGAVSVQTSSGINVSAGGVVAPFFVGNGAAITGVTDTSKVAKTGDTMTGQLTVSGASTTHIGTGIGGLPLSAGTNQTAPLRLGASGGVNVILDAGIFTSNNAGAWLQASNRNGLNTNYDLLLNPNGGRVGVSTAMPTHTLDVNGDALVRSSLTVAGNSFYVGTTSFSVLGGSATVAYGLSASGVYGIGTSSIVLRSLDATGTSAGAGVSVIAGHAGGGTGLTGGVVSISGGNGSGGASPANGGGIVMTGGNANGSGGTGGGFTFNGGLHAGGGVGGSFQATAGSNGASIVASGGTTAGNFGGQVTLTGGTGSQGGGSILVNAGHGTASASGQINLTAGYGLPSSSLSGGAINLRTGSAGGTGASGGAFAIVLGTGSTSDGILSVRSAAGTTYLQTLTGGNVGISTAMPTHRLDVNGDALVRSSLTVTGHALLRSTSATTNYAPLLVQNNASSELLRVQQDGRVGISTAGPVAPLAVSAGIAGPAVSIRNSSVASGARGIYVDMLGNTSGALAGSAGIFAKGEGVSGSYNYGIQGDIRGGGGGGRSYGVKGYVTGAGANYGTYGQIANTDPGGAIFGTVVGDLVPSKSYAGLFYGNTLVVSSATTSAMQLFGVENSAADSVFNVRESGDTYMTGTLALTPSGTTPDTTYHGQLRITKPASSGQYINLTRAANIAWSLGTLYNTNTFAIGMGDTTDSNFTNTAGSPITLAINQSGYVAVQYLAGATSNQLCYDTTSISNMNTLATCTSSRRYKEDISRLPVDKKKLFELEPVRFKWKGREERGVGLIAEEVAARIPELTTQKNGKTEGVRYGELSVYLLDIVRDQDKDITDLRDEMRALKAELKALKENAR